MVDHQFADADLAALYDRFHPSESRGDYGFYLPLVMAADSVLDLGCGTGSLLRAARDAGHAGRLCGLDPAEGMLAQARVRSDIEWIHGDLSTVAFAGEFDLIVMAGHAFQVYLADADIRAALKAVRAALTGNGRFAFETRNPADRAWERWTPEHAAEITDPPARMSHRVTEVTADTVSFTTTYSGPGWTQESRSTLRFLDAATLAGFLAEAGLDIEEQFGDWNRNPLTGTSREIITIVRPRHQARP